MIILACKNLFLKFKLLLIFLFCLNSCFITKTPGFYSGYNRLNKERKSKIIRINDMDSLPNINDSMTYAITAKHLKTIVNKKAPCIIYFWSPCCKGSVCISLRTFKEFCNKNGYNSIIIAEYFDYETLDAQNEKYCEVLAINHWEYGTDYCNAYVSKFQKSFFSYYGLKYSAKDFNQYLYYDGQSLSNIKPKNLINYPWNIDSTKKK